MSFIRRLALKISGAVVRWASPGCREWAEGLAREVAFIDDDWRALGWAIGSARVLLDRREAPIGSLEKASIAAQDYFENKRTLTFIWGWVGAAVATLLFSLLALFVFSDWGSLNALERAGICVAIWVLLYGGYLLYVYANRPREVHRPLDLYGTVAKYRSELQRMYENRYGWKGRLLNLALATNIVLPLYSLYRLDGFHGFVLSLSVSGVLSVAFSEVRDYQKGRNRRRRIAELDAMLARGVEEAES